MCLICGCRAHWSFGKCDPQPSYYMKAPPRIEIGLVTAELGLVKLLWDMDLAATFYKNQKGNGKSACGGGL